MERQQDIEERSRDLIKNADEKERQELKCFDLQYGVYLVLLFLVLAGYFFVQYEDFRDQQAATPEQLQSIIHETPCAGEVLLLAIQTNTGTSSEPLTLVTQKRWRPNARIKKRLKQYVKNNLTH